MSDLISRESLLAEFQNPDSYGTICVRCNQCGRFNATKHDCKTETQAKAVESNIFHDLLAAQEELKILEEIKQAESCGISVAALRMQNHCKKVNEQMKHNTGFYNKE